MITTQIFRIVFICIFALLTHAVFNIGPNFGLSKQIQYPLIIGITPYVISKLPLLSTKDLMTSGIQPLMSLTFLLLCTIGAQHLVREIKLSNQKDIISTYIKDSEPLAIQGFKFERDFVFVLIIVLIAETIFQGLTARNKYSQLEKALLRALEKYHGKK